MATTTIGFDNESPGDFPGIGVDGAFLYQTAQGSLYVNQYGNPDQDLEPSQTAAAPATLSVTSLASASFAFLGLDFAAYAPTGTDTQTLTVSGYANGVLVGTDTYTLDTTTTFSPSYANWTSETASQLAGKNIDDLQILLGGSATSYAAIDNLLLGDPYPVITGTTAGQTTQGEAPVTPFANVSITDPNSGALDTVTITLSGAGGTLADGEGFDGLALNPDGTYTLRTDTPEAVTAELAALVFTPAAPTAQDDNVTTFTLFTESSAGTSASDATTSVADTPSVTPDEPDVAFNPTVRFLNPNTAVLTGTASADSGISSVEIFDGTTSLGTAQVFEATGRWSFRFNDGPGLHDDITAVATSEAGGTATAESGYTLTTGIAGEPYTAVQDSFDELGRSSGQTLFRRAGAIYQQSRTEYADDGSYARTTDNGTVFNREDFFAYVDRYDAQGVQTEEDVFYKDGHQTVQGLVSGITLNSIYNDTFFPAAGGGNTFAFTSGFGQDTITDFILRGPDHDTIQLPGDAGPLRGILARATNDENGDAVLNLNGGDSITVQGVSVAGLRRNRGDFTFGA